MTHKIDDATFEAGMAAFREAFPYWSDSIEHRLAEKIVEAVSAAVIERLGWQPIETAPKDGSWIKVLADGGEHVVRWVGGPDGEPPDWDYDWYTDEYEAFVEVTHWKAHQA